MGDPGFNRLVVLSFAIAVVGGLTLWAGFRVLRRKQRPLSGGDRFIAIGAAVAAAIGLACFGWSFFEADWTSQTHLELRTAKLPAGRRVRIVHLSDLHLDRERPFHAELVQQINALEPDLFIFTGDSINAVDGLSAFRKLLDGIHAPLGRYAVRGNHDVWYWADKELFGGGIANELEGDVVDLAELPISICGAPYASERAFIRCVERAAPSRFVLAAYHTPDLVERFSGAAPDLYLAGHTHGGQVRVPFYGALVTLSVFDKKYEMGQYQVGPTTLFVSRGVGVEPSGPRIRFLCRPEIAVIDLLGG